MSTKRPDRKLTPGQWVILRSALIQGRAAIIAALIVVLGGLLTWRLSSHSVPPSRAHHHVTRAHAPRVSSASQPTFKEARAEIRSPNLRVRDQGVTDFSIVDSGKVSQTAQWQIVKILESYLGHYAALKGESSAETYAYCASPVPLNYNPYFTEALKMIGSRSDGNVDKNVDLSGLNLAYAILDDLNFSHVHFDNDLLCRTWFIGDSFQHASFVEADLRFTRMLNAQGLTVGQLRATSSLCKAIFSPAFAARKPVEYLTHRDLPLCFIPSPFG